MRSELKAFLLVILLGFNECYMISNNPKGGKMLLKSKLTDLEKNKPKQFSFAMKKKMLLGKSKTQFDIVLTVILSIVSLGLTILNIIVETLLDKFLISKNKALWQTFLTDTYFAQREAKEDLCHSVRQINAVMFQVYDINEFRQVSKT